MPSSRESPGPFVLAAHAVVLAVWLTAAFAAAESASGDRYLGYHLFWTGLLAAAGLLAALAVIPAALQRVGLLAAPGPLAVALGILFAAALSLDVSSGFRAASKLGAVQLLLLGGGAALAAWNLWRARASRLSFGVAMAVVCLAWILCGLLRAVDARTLGRLAILLPAAAALASLLPGLPRLDPVLSPFRLAATLVAGALLILLPLSPRLPVPTRLAAPAAKPPASGRSAVLIVLDTLRRDHMSLYGYHRKTTPSLERRAATGLVFDDASSVASWTLPSHASMMTGLWPRSHGAHAFRPEKGQVLNVYPLAKERVTLAELARERGYRTAGFTANHFYLSPRFGMEQGFEEYLCRRPRRSGLLPRRARMLARRWDARRAVYQEKPYFTAPEMTRAAIAWLERHRDTPFFLFLNYMDVHMPTAAPGSQGLPFEEEAFHADPAKREQFLRAPLAPAEQRSLVNEYDREVIHLDRWVGQLLDHLERSGLADRTLVVLTSDHGEFLGERLFVGHGKDVHAETVNVPLVVWEPGAAPGRVARPVQSPDVFPTILRYLGLGVPEGTQGQPLPGADHATVSEEHYNHNNDESHGRDRILRSIRLGEHRYFLSTTGEERLFDLGADPGETHNLISELPGVAKVARARLEEWLQATPEAPPQAKPSDGMDAEVIENLRALGYLR
jgi:arylsulfatase A-like enzyme